jgi:hypothetical protein
MSTKVDQFCEGLRGRLNSMETRLKKTKMNVQTLAGQAEKAVREQLDETRRRVLAQKERVDRTWADLRARGDRKLAETKETINEWKTKHEIIRLQARAERADAYAADALTLAALLIDESEEAILDAVVARMDLDAAQTPAAAGR